ncbi:MAG: hypothetical protein U0V87_11380 [Acidobacteriota bacterium]
MQYPDVRFSGAVLGFLVALPALAAPPDEVAGLTWCSGSKECVSWSSVAGATQYLVYKGDAATLPALATTGLDSCSAGAFTATTTGDLLIRRPGPGELLWYLVTARNADGEGSAGTGTNTPRLPNANGKCCGELAFRERFNAANGAPWPPPWQRVCSVDRSDVQNGSGRYRPVLSGYSLARLTAPIDERDVEVRLSMQFEDSETQGIGFYVRQNGGCLQNTPLHGAGYAVFVEDFRTDGIGVWRERDGNEESISINFNPSFDFQNGVRYRVRFRCLQESPVTTRLQAKFWIEGSAEPAGWQVDAVDGLPSLQGVSGGLAADSWSNYTWPGPPGGIAHTFIDDVEIERVCPP